MVNIPTRCALDSKHRSMINTRTAPCGARSARRSPVPARGPSANGPPGRTVWSAGRCISRGRRIPTKEECCKKEFQMAKHILTKHLQALKGIRIESQASSHGCHWVLWGNIEGNILYIYTVNIRWRHAFSREHATCQNQSKIHHLNFSLQSSAAEPTLQSSVGGRWPPSGHQGADAGAIRHVLHDRTRRVVESVRQVGSIGDDDSLGRQKHFERRNSDSTK